MLSYKQSPDRFNHNYHNIRKDQFQTAEDRFSGYEKNKNNLRNKINLLDRTLDENWSDVAASSSHGSRTVVSIMVPPPLSSNCGNNENHRKDPTKNDEITKTTCKNHQKPKSKKLRGPSSLLTVVFIMAIPTLLCMLWHETGVKYFKACVCLHGEPDNTTVCSFEEERCLNCDEGAVLKEGACKLV